MQFIILSSSRGTTMQAVIDSMKDGSLEAECLGLISDKEDRGCVEKARNANLPVVIVEKIQSESREEYDKRVHEAIELLSADETPLLACMGWMFIFSPWFVQKWRNRIVNVHPALLPKYPGAHAIRDALNAHDTETGMTIHVIDEGVDTGPILLQERCDILEDDTEETLKERIQKLEKVAYTRALQMIQKAELDLPS